MQLREGVPVTLGSVMGAEPLVSLSPRWVWGQGCPEGRQCPVLRAGAPTVAVELLGMSRSQHPVCLLHPNIPHAQGGSPGSGPPAGAQPPAGPDSCSWTAPPGASSLSDSSRDEPGAKRLLPKYLPAPRRWRILPPGMRGGAQHLKPGREFGARAKCETVGSVWSGGGSAVPAWQQLPPPVWLCPHAPPLQCLPNVQYQHFGSRGFLHVVIPGFI